MTKSVNPAFYGSPDPDARPKAEGVSQTGVRRGVLVRRGVHLRSGGAVRWRRSADEVAQPSAVSLYGGGFARVVTAKEVVEAAQ